MARAHCFGDAGTPCPCGNSGAPGHGCANSASASGARLAWSGAPCASADDFALHTTSSSTNQAGVFFQGDLAINGGLGIPFGDGLRCADGAVVRLEVAHANAAGVADSTIPIASTTDLSAGDVRHYQWWYRDPSGSPCGSGFNLTNALEVIWGP